MHCLASERFHLSIFQVLKSEQISNGCSKTKTNVNTENKTNAVNQSNLEAKTCAGKRLETNYKAQQT